jgi:hypothetical protein
MIQRITPGWAGVVVFGGGALVLCVAAAVLPAATPPCSAQHPCSPDVLGNLVFGALVTLPFLGWLALRLAALTALVTELLIVGHDVLRPAEASVAIHVAVVGLAVLCAVLAWRVPARRPRRRPTRWHFAAAVELVATGFVLSGLSASVTTLLIPAMVCVLLGAGLLWRFRDDATAPELAPPRQRRGPHRRADGWPELGWPGVLATVVLVLTAIVLGIVLRERILLGLVRGVCGDGDCPHAPMAVIGWAAVAVPLLLAATIYLAARPGWVALGGLLGSVSLLAFTLAASFFGRGATAAAQQQEFFAAHPQAVSLRPGFGCATAALFAGVLIGRLTAGRRRRGGDPTTAATPLLAVVACELIALPVAMVIAG